MASEIIRFEVGKTYYDRSICDHNCIFDFEILRRTAKSVWIMVDSVKVSRRVSVNDRGVECFKPFGTYSMCSVVCADKEMTPAQAVNWGDPADEGVSTATTNIKATDQAPDAPKPTPKTVRLSTRHPVCGTASYSCEVVRVNPNGTFWLRVPETVRARLKTAGWPLPLDGKKYGLFNQTDFPEFN